MNTAIVLAAGKGTRMNAGMNKQFMLINDRPLLAQTLAAFQSCNAIDSIILVALILHRNRSLRMATIPQ